MYRKICISIILMTVNLAVASCTDFKVNETKYRGDRGAEGEKICKFTDIKSQRGEIQCDVTGTGEEEEFKCSIKIDDQFKTIDYTWNYKNQICPGKYSVCNIEEEYCTDDDGIKCENEKKKYDNDESGICSQYICENENWKLTEIKCDNGVSCRFNSEKLFECGECKDGDKLCENAEDSKSGHLTECIWGNKIEKECMSGDKKLSCNPTNNDCGVCLNGEKRYREIEGQGCGVSECSGGEWSEFKVGNENVSCKKGGEYGECLNGDSKCENSETAHLVYRCDEGVWKSENSCDKPCFTSEETGKAYCGECLKDYYEDDDDNKCRYFQCENGLKKCENCDEDVKVSCQIDKNGTIIPGECLNGEQKCENNEKGQLSVCINGNYVAVAYCEKCIDNQCVGNNDSCEKNVCNDIDGKVGVLTLCENGSPKYESCNDKSCHDNSCGECLNESTNCGNVPLDKIKCENGNVVCKDENSEECQVILKNYRCEKNIVQCIESANCFQDSLFECKDGRWTIKNTCPESSSCRSTEECGVCRNGSQMCKDNSIYQCESGQWKLVDECQDVSCHEENGKYSCGECTDGNTRYEPSQGYFCYESNCVNGRWVRGRDCGKSCKGNSSDGYKCGDCRNYTITYGDSGSGKLRTCLNGKYEYVECNLCWGTYVKEVYDYYLCNAEFHSWCSDIKEDKISCCMKGNVGYNCFNTKQQCMNGNSCIVAGNAETYCGNCQNFTKKCSDDKSSILTCINGNWGYSEVCPNGCEEDKCKD